MLGLGFVTEEQSTASVGSDDVVDVERVVLDVLVDDDEVVVGLDVDVEEDVEAGGGEVLVEMVDMGAAGVDGMVDCPGVLGAASSADRHPAAAMSTASPSRQSKG